MEEKVKRTRRTSEEVKADKIERKEQEIKEAEARLKRLKAELEDIKNYKPKVRQKSNKTIAKETLEELIKSGVTIEDIMQKLK